MEVLKDKPYHDKKSNRYLQQFGELKDGAEHCNNVSTMRSYADKADALKIRLLNEMDELDAQLAKEKAEAETAKRAADQAAKGEDPLDVPAPEPVKVKTTKNIAIKTVTGTASWRLTSEVDVDNHLAALRNALLEKLDGDTIVNVEF
jgi:hypothetical protein